MYRLLDLMKLVYVRIYQFFCPIQKQVTFVSFSGKQYSDNPRAISEKLHQVYPDYKIVWMFDNVEQSKFVPDYVTCVAYNGKNIRNEVSKSIAFVTNCEIDINLGKRKGQFFIQTWHGDICFKKMLYEVDETLEFYDNKDVDLCIAGSRFGKERFKSIMKYDGEVLSIGCPRNDILVRNNSQMRLKIKEELKIDKNIRVLLFAPTFRDSNKLNFSTNLDLNKVVSILQNKTNNKWIVLSRAHVGTVLKSDDGVRDITDYPDMANVLLITDFLISDYSSCATDFLIKDFPVVLYQPDIYDYEKNNRKLVFDSREAGFIVAYSSDELFNILETTSLAEYQISNKKVCEYFGMNETGNASEKVVELINEKYMSLKRRRLKHYSWEENCIW